MPLTVSGRLQFTPNYSKAADLLSGGLIAAPAITLDLAMGDGTGADQADLVFFDQRTLSASATENLDLAGGLTDVFGAALTFVKVKLLYVAAASGNTNTVVVGGAGSNTFVGPFADATDKIAVAPGDCFLSRKKGTGWTVTAGTGDILLMANGGAGTPVTYDIVIIGTSA